MTLARLRARPSLVRTLTLRLAATAMLAILLQLSIVIGRTYLAEDDLMSSFVTRGAEALMATLRTRPDGPLVKQGRLPPQYTGPNAEFYAFRIIGSGGGVLAERNPGLIASISPWGILPSTTQDLWLRNLDRTKRLYVAGGFRERVGDTDLWIEVATLGDPDRVFVSVIAQEVLDDVWMPMIPLVVLLLGVSTLTVHRSLWPLVAAAKRADSLSPLDHAKRFEISEMPLEAASLAAAINRLLDRAGDLVASQRMFIARAAHELRTPLAVMLLELERIEDPRARRLEDDVRSMSEIVNRLLTLARLEMAEQIERSEADVAQIAADVIDRMPVRPQEGPHSITLSVQRPARVNGDPAAIREALRNLVENAVRHTPPGTSINVQIGPGGHIVVEDSGPGLGATDAAELLQPFRKGRASSEGAGLGLAIVRQAVDLHGGTLEISQSTLGGARFALKLPSAASDGASRYA